MARTKATESFTTSRMVWDRREINTTCSSSLRIWSSTMSWKLMFFDALTCNINLNKVTIGNDITSTRQYHETPKAEVIPNHHCITSLHPLPSLDYIILWSMTHVVHFHNRGTPHTKDRVDQPSSLEAVFLRHIVNLCSIKSWHNHLKDSKKPRSRWTRRSAPTRHEHSHIPMPFMSSTRLRSAVRSKALAS